MELYQQLEEALAKWSNTEYVVACSSGTASLHLALEALSLPPGSGVIVPNYTMIACARAVTLAGLNPIFVDCNSQLLLDPDLVDLACSQNDRIRAVMPVHIYGRRCDMESLGDLAMKYDLCVIEDLAEGHGITPYQYSDAACWSFYKNKIVAGEEGGAVSFYDSGPASLACSLRCLGFTEDQDYNHVPRGHNYRMSNCHARLILGSLRVVQNNLLERRRIEAMYDKWCPEKWKAAGPRQAPWVYDLRIPGLTKHQQERIILALRGKEIPARYGFKPMLEQVEYAGLRGYTKDYYLSEASVASREVIYLPIQPGVIDEPEVVRAIKTIHESL